MGKRLTLPLSPDTGKKPTVDAIRRRLGGRASTDADAGELLSITDAAGHVRTGVVLFVRGADLDVWIEHGVVRRVRKQDTSPCQAPVSGELAEIANDARVFARLGEGQRVRYQHESGLEEGTLVEKCRFGGIIERDDRVVFGVGFRRIWPAVLPGLRES